MTDDRYLTDDEYWRSVEAEREDRGRVPDARCTARLDRQRRCELAAGHAGDHARGMREYGGGTFTEIRARGQG